jgi:hypothetical protein
MKTLYKVLITIVAISLLSCEEHLTELNVNPNGVDPAIVNPNLLVPTVIVSTAYPYLEMNYNGHTAGVMQYVQLSGWSDARNNYAWREQQNWDHIYSNLRDIQHLYNRAVEEDMEFHQGLSIVVRAFNFGYIADTWGSAPYSAALNALEGGQEDLFPVFDSQEAIYMGIIDELKNANTVLSKPASEYNNISTSSDILFNGDPMKWRRFGNSLMLRYYMRVSSKLPDYAKAGIEEIVSNPNQYPIFTSNDGEAALDMIGSSSGNSWPATVAYDASESDFDRIQLCAGLRDVLVDFNDPRLGVWFNKVRIPIKVSSEYDDDEIVDGVRYLHPNYIASNNMVIYNKDTWIADTEAGKVLIDTMEYAGIPIAFRRGDASPFNLNPAPIQGGPNVHSSALSDMYKEARGDMLKGRMVTYAEVNFILAEAAQKGWNVGSQKDWYEKGIEASLNAYGVGSSLSSYLNGDKVNYDGSLEQIMTQKWIANWTVAHEAWCDWRRTGLPNLDVGTQGLRAAMPLRYQYGGNEISRNTENYRDAISSLQQTDFTEQDGNDSSWSKFWLLQGTNQPY